MIVPGSDNPLLLGSQGYLLQRSLRFRSSASAYLNRTPASVGNRTTWTWSGWVKRGTFGNVFRIFSCATDVSPNDQTWLRFNSDDTLELTIFIGGAVSGIIKTSQVFRDFSAWYHIVAVCNTTSATSTITGSSTDRLRLYVNGNQVTALTATVPAQNTNSMVNNTFIHSHSGLVRTTGLIGENIDGYLTEINFIDGQALTPSSFGQTDPVTGVWQPKKYTGTYGTNGFYLNFNDNSAATAAAIGKDSSGNGNNWTPNNISLTAGATYDSMTDVPTLTSATAANYCVLNPLNYVATLPSGGNLTWNLPSGGTARVYGSMGVSTGKWYFEVTITAFNPAPFNGYMLIGISYTPTPSGTGRYTYVGSNDSSVAGYKNNGTTNSAYGANYTVGDIVGVAYDLDAGTITFYKNGTSQGTAFTSITAGDYFPVILNDGGASAPTTYNVNFGQRPFAYTPPSGFVALNTFNLPDSTIKKGNQYFDVNTWTGDGTSTRTITGIGFTPDLIWAKGRSGTTNNFLWDSVRGSGGTSLYTLYSNLTNAEANTLGASGNATAIVNGGFTASAGSTDFTNLNGNSSTYVAWQWNAGGSTVTNTAGSISSQVRANPTAGFSIVTYTGNSTSGATVGHGLGVAPKMIICKIRSTTNQWAVYHASLGATQYVLLNNTQSTNSSSSLWNNTSPTSSVFSIGTDGSVNAVGNTYVAYCFAEVAGFSKFGSISANGAADNAFVYTGFLPRYVMLKRTDTTSNWIVLDTARNKYNVLGNELYPNLSNAEASATDLDILSNGFKLRNASFAGTWIYAAFAENPMKYALAR